MAAKQVIQAQHSASCTKMSMEMWMAEFYVTLTFKLLSMYKVH